MTDPNPLLSQPESAAEHHHLDDAIEHCIGDSGRKQLIQSAVSSLAWFFDAQQSFISVFTDALPKYSCKHSTYYYYSNNNNHISCNICQLPKDSWSWDLPPTTSIISEWSLECSGSVITGLPASSFFVGCLAGGFLLAALADSFLGRKNLLLLSCLIMSVSGVLTTLSPNIWVYSGFRFVSGFGRASIGTCVMVLATELVGKKWRGNVGIFGFIWFALGFLSLPIIAFLLKGSSWRFMYLCTCVPCLIYSVSLYFLVHESPRWLFVRGRKQEFANTLTNITESFLENFTELSQEYNSSFYSALKILINKRWAFRRLAAVMAVGFGLGTIYYGMPLGLGNLSFDLYLSVALNAFSELPASLVTFFLIGKIKRKSSVLGLAVLSGICSVGCGCVVVITRRNFSGIQIPLELLSFFCGCTAADVLLIYTLELFPTCVRNSAVAMVRQAILLGGVVSPMVVAAAAAGENGWLSYGVFGAAISMCGLFVVWLPETTGKTLCDTMEEEELKTQE